MIRLRPHPRAFTLVELLVALGIAAVLMALLIGVVSKVKQAAYRSSTAATIAALQGAIEAYYQNFKAYPGPISDETICGLDNSGLPGGLGNKRPTMSENLVLGLCGGLGFDSSGQNIIFSTEFVGRGPRTLANAGSSKIMAPFYGANDRITSYAPVNPAWWGLVIASNQQPLNTDSMIPEFLDTYPETMPILYYRAHRSAPGVASDSSSNILAPYDVRQNSAYVASPAAMNLGMARPLGHGLQLAGTYGVPPNRPTNYRYNLTTFMASPNDPSRPRVPDGYVLIAAGPARIYGTDDNIVSFGKVAP
ncbi:MAG: type II secretion system protein [Tepidisphaerales bacterium]